MIKNLLIVTLNQKIFTWIYLDLNNFSSFKSFSQLQPGALSVQVNNLQCRLSHITLLYYSDIRNLKKSDPI